jgi:hypothetical protein
MELFSDSSMKSLSGLYSSETWLHCILKNTASKSTHLNATNFEFSTGLISSRSKFLNLSIILKEQLGYVLKSILNACCLYSNQAVLDVNAMVVTVAMRLVLCFIFSSTRNQCR